LQDSICRGSGEARCRTHFRILFRRRLKDVSKSAILIRAYQLFIFRLGFIFFEVSSMSAKCLRANLFVALTLLGFSAQSHAGVIFYSSVGSFNSALPSAYNTENVLFNQNTSGPALTVTGLTNQTQTPVDITSNVNLTGTGGQALAVQAENGSFSNATINYQDASARIQALIFNLDNANGKLESDTLVRLTVTTEKGSIVGPEDFVDQGNNIFGVIAFDGDAILKATVQVLADSKGSSIDVLQQLYQIRVAGGVGAAGNEPPPPAAAVNMPEPVSWLVFGSIFVGALIFASRKRMQQQLVRIPKAIT
jgi:hypothetical protein